jgi:HEAT repeat protein
MLNIEALIRNLFATDEGLRQRAANYLREAGAAAIEPLLQAIEKDDCSEDAIGYENRFIRRVFIQFGEPAFQAVIRAFDTDFKARAAVKTIVLFRDARAVPILMQHIEHYPKHPSAIYAIEALGYFHDPRSFEFLHALLMHAHSLTRYSAAVAIAEYHDPAVIEALQTVLASIPPQTGYNYWQQIIQDSIRFAADPNFKPASRGFFINNRYVDD